MIITSTIPKPYLLKNLRCFSVVSSNLASASQRTHLRVQNGLRECLNPTGLTHNAPLLSGGGMTRLFSTSSRNFCSNDDQSQMPHKVRRSLPAVMDFEEIVWPNIFKTIKNFIFVQFIIRPYFDKDFTLKDFVDGSKQALSMISSTIASGTDMDTLKGLVTQDAIYEIKNSVSHMSMAQRNQLAVDKEDIYFCFPYQIGIMFDESEAVQKRWVEITMVYHVLRGAHEYRNRQEPIPMNIGMDPQHQEKFSVCNYRFIKEFTKEQHSDWVVNVVNHFKPIDKARRQM